jgi:glyoxylase-like metal-dependent hydrolase (beta-lactamase superfamily II)
VKRLGWVLTLAGLLLTGTPVLAETPAPAAPAEPLAAPAAGTVQVLDRDADGRPLLARVALVHALPEFAENRMALGGTWSYLIRDGDGVLVLDVGPRYPLAWSLVPWASWKVLTPKLDGNAHILKAVETVYPGCPITTIVLTHWHADHTEDAPALQRLAFERWGVRPPLRMTAADRPHRWRGLFPIGAEAIFSAAGFHRSEWIWGLDLREGERLGKTGFRVLGMPGHTAGNIALIDPDRRISLGPTPRIEPPRESWWAEDMETYRATALRFYHATFGYRHYSTHPGREATETWPGAPESRKSPAGGRTDPDHADH